ncbi:MAG: mechanosensitive ion channel [Proteobacteria bacterium]|nr:mechanosensitive ion channel [Pseudomonadota bacterium]
MDQLHNIFEKVLSLVVTVWSLELFKSGGNPILLNQVIIATIHLVVGFIISKKLSIILSQKIIQRSQIDEVKAHMLRRIIYFVLLTVFVLIALPIAGIPIAAFAILGSAVAIGVGFGAQNLFNNLISSFILMVEKPIRIGDIVVLGDTVGRISDIGNRCVSVRRGDGIDVLVPNSHFLEKEVINWTLSDQNLRGELKIGVAYGSPVEKVKELLEKVALEHERVLKQPPPFVLVEDFGDNSLMFTLFFWARITLPLDLRRVSSALRFHIDALLREHDIVIAFPQRDVHLNSLQPIEVRMIKKEQKLDNSAH